MSANLDLVRSIFAGWERGDFSSAEWAHHEIEFVIVGGPSPGSWTGVTGMAEGHRGWVHAWENFRVEADEYRELDDDRVLVFVHLGGRGKTSGVSLDQIARRAGGANLFEIRDEKVTRLILYMDSNSALADLGLAG